MVNDIGTKSQNAVTAGKPKISIRTHLS